MTQCPSCLDLQQEVDRLRQRLAAYEMGREQVQLKLHLHLLPQEAWLLWALYMHNGEAVSKWWLYDNMPRKRGTARPETLHVRTIITRLRTSLPEGAIETHWGTGYSLTQTGMAFVQGVLKDLM